MTAERVLADGAAAGAVAAIVSAAPSTAHAIATGGDVLEPTRAAGSILLPNEQRPAILLLAAVPVHVLLSLGWGVVLAAVLRDRATPALGIVAGAAIAVCDLLVIGRRWPRIRELPFAPQLADHLMFGLATGLVLQRRVRPADS